ncbi:MAG: hypothetical protein V3T92_01840, partial [Anaerolineae bacterium]
MKSKLSILGFVLTLSVLIVSGCGAITAQPTAVPPPAVTKLPVVVPLTPVPAITPTVAVEASDAQAARDAALTYISEHYGEQQAPALSLSWMEEFTPGNLVGRLASYRYTAQDWVVSIPY